MLPFVDLFCGAGEQMEGFKRAGWMSLCGVVVSYSAVQSYLANHGLSAEGIIGSIEDPQIRQQIVHTYTGRVDAVVGGSPSPMQTRIGRRTTRGARSPPASSNSRRNSAPSGSSWRKSRHLGGSQRGGWRC